MRVRLAARAVGIEKRWKARAGWGAVDIGSESIHAPADETIRSDAHCQADFRCSFRLAYCPRWYSSGFPPLTATAFTAPTMIV